MFCTSTRSCARADYAKIVRSRDAQCNTEELPKRLDSMFGRALVPGWRPFMNKVYGFSVSTSGL